MLKQNLIGAAVSVCFTSSTLHAMLHVVLRDAASLESKAEAQAFHKKCHAILCDALERDEPRRFRVDDIRQIVRTVWPPTMFRGEAGHVIPFLDGLASSLLETSGSCIHYRVDALDDFTRLAPRIDPALLLAWKLGSDTLQFTGVIGADIEKAVESVQPFCAPTPDSSTVHADNHVHLSGTASEHLVLMQALRGSKSPTTKTSVSLTKKLASVQRLVHALLADINGLDDESAVSAWCARVLSGRWYVEPNSLVDWVTLERATCSAQYPDVPWFTHALANAICKDELASAWIWFMLWCTRQYSDKKCAPTRRIALFLILGTIMRVRRELFVEGYGLQHFLDASGKRDADVDIGYQSQMDGARRIFNGTSDVAEIKVGTTAVNERAYRLFTDQLLRQTHPGRAATKEEIVRACSRWHYSVHFSRGDPKLPKSADAVASVLQSGNAWTNIGITAGCDHPGHTVYPSRLIRTLDVAGNENSAKTELFAPSLRWLRSLPRPVDESRPLLLSIHAGEDFAHLVSGMRHVDETVRFCNMGPGDRIGHGLAMGINPAQWFKEHGHALVPIDEHFDNLVWAWHYAHSCPELPAAKEVSRAYARAARQLAPHVRWLNFGIRGPVKLDMNALYSAWELRRNCTRLVLKNFMGSTKDKSMMPDWMLLSNDANRPEHVHLFLRRNQWHGSIKGIDDHTRQTRADEYTVRLHYSRFSETAHLQKDESLRMFTAEISANELDFIEGLQDRLIEEFRMRGLVFEVNLTSNRYIGAIDQLQNHPVFRWEPPDQRQVMGHSALYNRFGLRKGPLPVCINTDDPGIMPSTLRTEFELLRQAALESGCKPDHVAFWLRRLRKRGRVIFMAAHPHTPEGHLRRLGKAERFIVTGHN